MLTIKSMILIVACMAIDLGLSYQLDSASALESRLEAAFFHDSPVEVDDFFKQWENASRPLAPDQLDNQPEEVKQAYILVQKFYRPFKDPLQEHTLPDSPATQIPYFVFSPELMVRVGDSLLLGNTTAHWRNHVTKELHIADFRPSLHGVDHHQLYLTKPYDAAVDSFLHRGSPAVRSKKTAFLSHWIKIATRYGGGVCSFPIVLFCHFDKSFTNANVSYLETPTHGIVLRYVQGQNGWQLAENPIESIYNY